MKTRLALFSLLSLAILLFLHPGPAYAAESGGTLRLGFNEPLTLDPALASYSNEIGIGSQVMEGLTRLDENLQVAPAIASSWSSPDAMTWKFNLRHDVKFHNGRPVRAVDFVYSWNRAKTAGGPYAGVFNKIASFTAQGKYTFVVTLVNPNAGFPVEATLAIYWVIPQESAATLATNPVGTGPFKFVRWVPGKKIVLEANAEYYDGAPYLDGIQYNFYGTLDQEWAAFQKEKLDITRIPVSQWQAYKDDPHTVSKSTMYTRGIGFKNQAIPDLKVRKAFQRAIDRASIAADPAVWPYSPGQPLAHGVVSPGKGSYDNSDINVPYDPTLALNLLASAGWTDTNGDHILDNGSGTKLSIVLPDSTDPASHAFYQAIADDLANIGGSGVGAQVSLSTSFQALTAVGISWVSDYPDPEADLSPYATGGFYAVRIQYSSAAFDNYLNTARATLDQTARNTSFHSADEQAVIKDAIVLPIYYGSMVPILTRPYVHDLVITSLDYEVAVLKNVWLTQPPDKPQLLKPGNGTTTTKPKLKLDWTDSDGIAYYEAELHRDAKKGALIANPKPELSEVKTPKLQTGTSYFWRARACNAERCSGWTKWWSFSRQ